MKLTWVDQAPAETRPDGLLLNPLLDLIELVLDGGLQVD